MLQEDHLDVDLKQEEIDDFIKMYEMMMQSYSELEVMSSSSVSVPHPEDVVQTHVRDDVATLQKQVDDLKSKVDEIMLHLKLDSKCRGEIAYDKLNQSIEKKFLNQTVAIYLSNECMTGYGDTIEDAHEMAISNSNKNKFCFRHVGDSVRFGL